MATKTRATGGVVPISLAGEDFELVANARAMLETSTVIGGFGNAFEALRSVNVALLIQILRIGIGRKATPSNLEDLVFENGVPDLLDPIGRYLLMLQNGGKMPDEEEEEVAQKPKGKATENAA